jgi:hypothetical protein
MGICSPVTFLSRLTYKLVSGWKAKVVEDIKMVNSEFRSRRRVVIIQL